MYLISTVQANPRAKLPGRQSANLYQSEESDGEAWPSLNACWQGPALIQASAHSALHCWPDFDVMCCKWPHPSLRQFVLTFSTGTWKVDGLQVRASAARLTFGHRASVRLPFHHRTLFLSLLSAWAWGSSCNNSLSLARAEQWLAAPPAGLAAASDSRPKQTY